MSRGDYYNLSWIRRKRTSKRGRDSKEVVGLINELKILVESKNF